MKPSISQFQAVVLALAGYTFWVFADVSLKIAGTSALPAYEVIAIVGLAIVVLMLAYGLFTGNLRALRPRDPTRQMLRSCLDLANTICVVVALRHLPLALFYIIIFFSPMLTTLLAAAFLGERLEWKKGIAILAGFAGVVIAVNPLGLSRAGDWTGYLACMVCVASFSASMVWSRVMTQTETPESLTFCSGAAMAVGGFAVSLGSATPLNSGLMLVLAGTGLFCVLGSLCFFAALRHASAATVSQYHYSQLLTGAFLGYLLWHERLSVSMLLGAALIIASGSYTAVGSYRTREPAGIPVEGL